MSNYRLSDDVAGALFVSMASDDFGLPNPFVLRFPTLEEAEQFALHLLVQHGELAVNPDGSIWSADRQERYKDGEQALADWQFKLGASEYFHVYACRDVVEQVDT